MTPDLSPENLVMLACVDPWKLAAQVASGKPDQVRDWGRRFRAAGAAAADAVTLGRR
jgi:hypothetical protein